MKRIISMVLILVMSMALCIPAFADESEVPTDSAVKTVSDTRIMYQTGMSENGIARDRNTPCPLSTTAHVNESISDYDSPKTSRENSYRIDFQNDILFDSPTMRSNLSTISESLDEIVFTVDAGDDTFTVGYYLGDEIYSLEKIMQQIEATVDEINSDIKNETRVSSNNHILLSDLQLKYIVVDTTEPVSDIELSLSGVMSSRRISKTPTVEEISEHKAVENVLRRANTIDGSYHHLEVIGNQAYTYWYNQLSGTNNMCSSSISAPHSGDGNNRYASGYQWFPNEVDVNFYTDVAENENRTKLWYKYN